MKRVIVLFSTVLLLVPFTALAQVDFCEGNFDYDRDQDGTDAFTFKTDFGRNSLKNPCPPDGPAPVPKTGRTTCYDSAGNARDCAGTGEDGEYQKGVQSPGQRFTDNGNGTVTDNLTGLIWLKNANCFGQKPWIDALSDCNGLNNGECELTDESSPGDWRLPNHKELFSLVDAEHWGPPLPTGHPFTNVQLDNGYWSSATYAFSTAYAWSVGMYDGFVDFSYKMGNQYVWPVRGGR